MRRAGRIGAVALLVAAAIQLAGAAVAQEPAPAIEADFDGDGFADLAVGAPGEEVGSAVDAGGVTILYGSASGLGSRNQAITQATPESGDVFGFAVATGDYNGDGFADLAVGVPGEDVGSVVNAGAVELFLGSSGGLPSVGSQLIRQGAGGVEGSAEAGDVYGIALASGRFDGDGFTDLAVGASGENVGAVADAGAVNVTYGSAGGLLNSRNQLFLQNNPETEDFFGDAVAVGDLTPGGGTGPADLAVGAPGETVNGRPDAGAVTIVESLANGTGLPGGAVGTLFFQGNAGVAGTAESGDAFGAALAVGEFGSGGIDLAVGAPAEDVGTVRDAGAVNILIAQGFHQILTQGAATPMGAVPGSTEAGDFFGAALTTGDFDNNNADNLAIGGFGEDVGSTVDAGVVYNLCGFDGQFFGCRAGLLQQGNPELEDFAGSALAAGDFNGDGLPDLANGAWGETVNGADFAGAVDVRNGADAVGLQAPAKLLFQSNGGAGGTASFDDEFGWSVASSVASTAPQAAATAATAGGSGAATSKGMTRFSRLLAALKA